MSRMLRQRVNVHLNQDEPNCTKCLGSGVAGRLCHGTDFDAFYEAAQGLNRFGKRKIRSERRERYGVIAARFFESC